MLKAWLDFVGRRPDEIVVVDGGTGSDSFSMYAELFQHGLIDKLYIMQPGHPENTKHTCFIQEYYSGVMASCDYLLFFKADTIPYRNGHEAWLDEYISILAGTPKLFSITGSSPGPGFLGESSEKYWCLEHTSENFALVPRRHHVAAMRMCEQFWMSGWRGRNPFAAVGKVAERCLVESAWDRFCRRNRMHCLMQKEDDSWNVLHTHHVAGKDLNRYLQRGNDVFPLVRPYFNRSGSMLGGR